MARLGTAFDATQHDTTQSDYSELPNGTYKMEIEAADVVPTSTGSGTILKTTLKVLEPAEYADRKLFNNYNIENKNPQAQEIGQRQFASLCRALEMSSVEDTDDLLFKSFTVRVALGKPSKDGQYPARAEIKKYFFPDENNVPEPSIDAQQPAAAAQRPANDNRPAAANTNKPAQPAKAAGSRPWSKA